MKEKIALAIITRNKPKDLILLERLLENVSDFVDGIFITNTTEGDSSEIEKLCDKYNANYSYFKWINDFSAARNFNFSQVPDTYEYIMWSDIDDVWRNLDKLKVGEKDAYAFWYLYAFDEDKQPIVAHKKTMIVRNDGSFSWKGKIHEDLLANREITIDFIEDIHRMHLTDEERIEEAKIRNLEIAIDSYKDDSDPRNLLNLANSHLGAGNYNEAKGFYFKFLEESQSTDEKYLARQNIASIEFTLGNREKAIEQLQICIGMEPLFPDAYFQLGQFLFDIGDLDLAEKYMLIGLPLKPSYRSMIVFNPRDYDYNPMNLLAKIYFRKSRPDLALPLLEGCLKINPDNDSMKKLVSEMKKEISKLQSITDTIKTLSKITDKEELKQKILSLPYEKRSHPGICMIWNKNFFKESSSGKDVSYYCGFTEHEWSPKNKKVGGSEEAVVHLSKRWAKQGYNVTVYANIGHEEMMVDNVLWKPFWTFNSKDAVDHLILWRSPKLCDYDLCAKNIYIDLHDVIQEGEFTKKRLEKIKKVFVKTKSHRNLFPTVPEDKIAIIPNGLDIDSFAGENKKEPFSILNTSSPDRSMEAVVKVFERVKEKIPEAKMYWAYGWEIYDAAHSGDKKMMEWKNHLVKEMDRVGIVQLGKVPQDEIVKWYKKCSVFLYPSEFFEIDCISVKKAQLAGCKVITTDFGALDESTICGIKIHSEKTNKNWSLPYQISFAVTDEKMIDKFVDETIKALESKEDINIVNELNDRYNWDIISAKWTETWNM